MRDKQIVDIELMTYVFKAVIDNARSGYAKLKDS